MKKIIISIISIISFQVRADSFGLTTEIQDAIKTPDAVRLYKGDPAPFDGGLIPFNGIKEFVQYRYNYEKLKQDYHQFGVIKDETSIKEKIGTYGAVFFAGMVIASALITSENQNTMLWIGAGGLATSVVILTF